MCGDHCPVTDVNPASLQSLCLELTADGQVLGSATGFVVDAGSHPVLVTTWHVLSGRDTATGKHLWDAPPDAVRIHHHGQSGETVTVDEPLLDAYQQPLWSTHPVFGPRVDVAALPLTRLEGVTLHCRRLVDLARSGDGAAVMSDVGVVGFPFGRRKDDEPVVWIRGTVATEHSHDYDGRPCFLIDARTGESQAGSPVLVRGDAAPSANGVGPTPHPHHAGTSLHHHGAGTSLVGVYSGRVSEDLDLGLVWKATAVVEVLVNAQSESILRRVSTS
jgi:hypothetical protein